MKNKTEAIRHLNDEFRSGQLTHDQHFITSGVQALGQDAVLGIHRSVAQFEEFTAENDPHGEHDFGSLTYRGHQINWKIDYYDLNFEYGSDDPGDSSVTKRVLTIMLAEEW